MQTKTASLYVHDNGNICCIDHAGSYLTSEYRYAPERHEYWTPLGTWERIDAAYIRDWTTIVGTAPVCETCRD
jgi:hypothetical protein